ncbi:ATP-binding protein [Streptomyces antioxidans]|nr:ATP-binding protein [Streptomyces antioxidans]
MLQFTVAPTPSAPRAARKWAGTVLEAWLQGTRDSVLLVLSELTTNAVREAASIHADTTLRVEIGFDAGCVIVSVTDPSSHLPPEIRHASDEQEHGRGLEIVSLVCRHMGSEPCSAGGKRVWGAIPVDGEETAAVLCPARLA